VFSNGILLMKKKDNLSGYKPKVKIKRPKVHSKKKSSKLKSSKNYLKRNIGQG
jgi:hypothetical protein